MADDDLSEDDVSVKLITPAIVAAGWNEVTQIRRQVFFTKGTPSRNASSFSPTTATAAQRSRATAL